VTCTAGAGAATAQLCDPKAAVSGCPLGDGGADAGACLSTQIGDWGLPPTYATCGGKGN
jgi:hypothetical protein